MTEKQKPAVDVVNELKAKAWNESIAPRAQALVSYLRAEVYQKGVIAFLRSQEVEAQRKLLTGCKTRDDDQFMRGYLVCLKEIIMLDEAIERTIQAKPAPMPPESYTESA